MKEKHIAKINEIIAPRLEPGEQVVAASFVQLGQVKLGKQFAMGVATAILTAGVLSVRTKPRPNYIVVTSSRIFFLEPGLIGGPSNKLNGSPIPLQYIAGTTEPKRGITTVVHVMIEGRDKALRLMFPRPCREDGDFVIASLRVPVLG